MKRTTTHLALLVISILITGCSVSSPKIPKAISPKIVSYSTANLENHRCLYEEAVTGQKCQNVDAGTQTNTTRPDPAKDAVLAKYWRDTMIGMIRRDIESFYGEYEKQLADSRRRFSSAIDVTSLAGVAAATITNPARAKTVISTMVAFVEGAHGKIDQNIFQQQTTNVIIQKMRASRVRLDAMILRKMDLDAAQYTFSAAGHDLRELFRAGALQSGFLELAASAGNDATQAVADRGAVEERRLLPIATSVHRDLSKKVGDKVRSWKNFGAATKATLSAKGRCKPCWIRSTSSRVRACLRTPHQSQPTPVIRRSSSGCFALRWLTHFLHLKGWKENSLPWLKLWASGNTT